MKLYLNWVEVYDEAVRGEDYVSPKFKFEWGTTKEEIAKFMFALNPNYPYFISQGSTCVEVIGRDEIDKHIEIFKKKAEIRRLQKEIGELEI